MIHLPVLDGTHSPKGPEGAQLHEDRRAVALLPQCSSHQGLVRDPHPCSQGALRAGIPDLGTMDGVQGVCELGWEQQLHLYSH